MAERKGFDTVESPTSLNFGIEDTESLDSSDLDSFLSDADPEDVNPIPTQTKEEPTTPDKKDSPTSTPPKQNKPEKKEEKQPDNAPEKELELDDFLDDVTDQEDSKDPEGKKKDTKPEEDQDLFQKYSDALLEMGIFSLDENEETITITNPQEFKERWEYEREKDAYNMLDKYIGRFGEKHKNFIVSVLNGVDPEKYFSAYTNVENFANLDISKEDDQKVIYREALKRQGLSSEKIEKKLQRAIELGELEDDAKDFHEILLEQEQEALTNIKKEKEAELERKENEKKFYNDGIRTIVINKLKEKEFDGIPVNEKVANSVYDFLTTEKYQLPDGELLTELDKWFLELKRPANYAKRVKLALLAQNDLNLEGIKKTAITKETNELFGNLKKNSANKQSNPTAPTTPKSPTNNTPRFQFDFTE